eukprot:2208497-Prymnesium_polylepis.1
MRRCVGHNAPPPGHGWVRPVRRSVRAADKAACLAHLQGQLAVIVVTLAVRRVRTVGRDPASRPPWPQLPAPSQQPAS